MIDMSRDTKPQESSISRAADKKNQYYSLLYTEMAERKRVEEHLRRSNLFLQALSQAQLQYVAGTELAQVFSSLLRTLLAATLAHQGLLREYNTGINSPDSSVLRILEGHAEAWEQEQIATIAEQVLLTRTLVLVHPANEINALFPTYQEVTPKTVEGQTSTYFLGLPITATFVDKAAENVVGVIVIAGRAEEYDHGYLELLQPLLSTCAQLIIAHRNDQRRRAAEHALVEERILLSQRVAERTAELSFSNAELARAARSKDEFLATMNHELRTPLNAVLLYAESLQTQLPGPLNERQLRAVGGIRESAQHLLLLINDILDVAKMDAGKLSLDIISSAVENVCNSSLRLVSEMAQKKQLELHFHRNPDVTQLDADERRLKQMLVNLLSNAIKFTPDGGKVGLEVNGDPENDTIYFTVWDTGIGLAQEDIKKLFQPFVQLDSSHARQHGGTGLGLFLVYRMAELHGGSVSVTSELNQGSRFTISLPWHQRRQPFSVTGDSSLSTDGNSQGKISELSVQSRPSHKNGLDAFISAAASIAKENSLIDHIPTVLIADDNEANIRVMSDILHEWQCRILVARTGLEAVQQTREERPDLILMDIQMPEMNGLDAIRLIRAEPISTIAQTPIVALTALSMPGDREQCLAAGADDYLSKPIQIERLTEVLNSHLQRLLLKESV